MEGVIKLGGAALAAVLAVMLIKQAKSEMHTLVGLAAAVGAGLYCVSVLGEIIVTVTDAAGRFGIDSRNLGAVFKIVGICIVCDFTADCCRESGLGALAGNVEFAGKLAIAAVSLPLAVELLEITVTVLAG